MIFLVKYESLQPSTPSIFLKWLDMISDLHAPPSHVVASNVCFGCFGSMELSWWSQTHTLYSARQTNHHWHATSTEFHVGFSTAPFFPLSLHPHRSSLQLVKDAASLSRRRSVIEKNRREMSHSPYSRYVYAVHPGFTFSQVEVWFTIPLDVLKSLQWMVSSLQWMVS